VDIRHSDVLIVVDVQNDFLPGGALAVPGGDGVVDPINRIMPLFSHVVATRDWHPREHPHFQDYGGPWPYHCLQDTPGAQFAPGLRFSDFDEVLDKGTDPHSHGYDAFENREFARRLRARGTSRVFICGLATDYCVRATALASAQDGFQTIVIRDAVAAVNMNDGDEAAAFTHMASHGIEFVNSDELREAARTSA
jgi:nicotinamidase/pyrazinamidase